MDGVNSFSGFVTETQQIMKHCELVEVDLGGEIDVWKYYRKN